MHEWALAEAVVVSASELAQKKRLRKIAEVRIKIGELQQIDKEIFEFALEQLKTSMFDKARFTVETTRAAFRCRFCNCKWLFSEEKIDSNLAETIHFVPEIAHAYIKCPRCGSSDFEVVEGRGVWLESVHGAK